MSGAQTSTFADPNILYKTLSGAGYQEVEQNRLLNQQRTQEIGAADMAMMGQAGASLLNLPEDQAATLYPQVRDSLQGRGFGKDLPATYPGHAAVQAFVQRAMPLMDQFTTGYITPPGTQAAIDAALRPGSMPPTTSGGGGGGTSTQPAVPAYGGGPGNVPVPPEYMPYFQEASQRTGIPVDLLIAQSRQESGFNPGATGAAGEVGLMQIHPKTAASPGFGMAGVQNPDVLRDPRTNINFGADYLAARAKAIGADLTTPQGQAAALRAYNGGGDQNYVANVFRYMPPSGGGSGTGRPAAPVIAGDSLASQGGLGGSGVEGASPKAVLAAVQADSRAGKYSGQPVVLSTGASNDPTDLASVEQQIREAQGGNAGKITVLGVGPAVEAKAPGTNAKLAALSKAYGADFVPLPADQMSPDGVHPTAQGYATLKAAIAPSQGGPGGGGQPARYQVASNAPTPPPGSTAPPAALPRDQAVVQAQRTGQAVPVAGVDGLWALPNGNLSSTPPTAQPAAQPQAQVPQPPANRVMPGGADGPPAQTPPPAQQPPPGARANLPRAADIPTGVNSQQYRDAADLQRRALILEAQVDPTGRLKQLAAGLRQQAQLLLQTDSVVQTQEGQLHPLTGQIGDPTKPLPHYVYDPTQHAYIDTTGTNKPEFEPAQRESAVALRDVMELGPKVANGTATQQEQARYAAAAEAFRQPVLRENPVTKETVRVNTRELPPDFPEPTGFRGAGPGGPATSGGSNVVMPGYSPQQQEIERDPAKAKVADMQYERNSKEIGAINDSVREAQANNIRVQEMRNIMDNISTGPGTGSRAQIAAWLQRWAPASLSGWTRDYGNLDGAAAVEAFTKLGLTGAGQQERSVLGNRGGYRAIEMFKAANPNVDLLNPANSSILATQLISNQANIDYAQAASKHFAEQEQRYGDTHKYTSLEQFDQQWNAQRNPQVYAAAMGAISGQKPEQWTKGLNDAEYNRALDIISRADPSAVVNTKEGRKVMQPKAPPPPPPGFSVIR